MLLESIFVLEFMKEQSQQKSQDIKVADFSLQMYFRLLFFFFFSLTTAFKLHLLYMR